MRTDDLVNALQEIDQCERAVIDLLSPDTKLSGESRERIARLLEHFRRLRSDTLEQAANDGAT